MIPNSSLHHVSTAKGLLALSPLAVFLVLYLVTSLLIGDFYKMPISVAFIAASIYGIAITGSCPLRRRVEIFSEGAADVNIIQMIWIFALAGSFASCATLIGSIDATVALVLKLLPGSLIPAGLFAGACFISLSVGTSVGTIVALAPVGAGIAEATGASQAFMMGIVVGGAFFGDNLSFISDTTIAATRTQGCPMIDKFKANIRVVLPAAVITLVFYVVCGVEGDLAGIVVASDIDYAKIAPYLVVLGCSLAGMYVGLVLTLGIASAIIVGLAYGQYDIFDMCQAMGDGIAGMGNLIIITLLAGGMLSLIRHGGGIDLLLRALTGRIRSRKGAAFSIAALVSVANVCTANNTIAIITVGPLAADIARRFGVEPRKSASILDTFSCVVQGVLPYGAQLLMAASLASISPLSIIGCLFYPMAVLVCAVLGILVRRHF